MIQGTAFKILSGFTSTNARNFAELCQQAGYPTDLGGYYIRQLVRSGHLVKQERGLYAITAKGKQQLASSHGQKLTIPRPRLLAMLVAKQADHYVIVRRTIQPFIGTAEWPAVSIIQGESLQNSAARAAQERLGVDDHPAFAGFFRRIDMYNDFVFDDKLFAVHTLGIAVDQQIQSLTFSGEIHMCSQDELRTIARPAKSLFDILHFVEGGQGGLVEHTYQLQAADLA